MRNIFSSKLKIHFKYDVKGSTFGRSATDKKKLNSCPTLKDTEFLENKCIIDIGPEQKLIFMERLKRDVQFLVDQHKIDYSLSIGIHDLDQDDIERHKRASVVDMNISDSSSFDYSDGSESPTRMDDSNVFDEPFHMRSSELSTRRESYNIGFADILTHYNRRKKSVILTRRRLSTSDADETLIVQPELYARRFLDFIDKHCI
ncbi:unnamed protein product [Rotaria magnacalcarata]|nr:unnamed protein product [Rotaria magnacalcarata]CAF4805140.1 unnamed protein product [Rotaria magnacalcarata]